MKLPEKSSGRFEIEPGPQIDLNSKMTVVFRNGAGGYICNNVVLTNDICIFCVYGHQSMWAAVLADPALFTDSCPLAALCCWRRCSARADHA